MHHIKLDKFHWLKRVLLFLNLFTVYNVRLHLTQISNRRSKAQSYFNKIHLRLHLKYKYII